MKFRWPFGKIVTNAEIQSRFLSRSVLLTEQGSSSIVRLIVWISILILILFVLWASNLQINEVASATGKVQPHGELVKIEHLLGGKILEILVEEGQHVEEGDVLIRLDPQSILRQLEETQMNLRYLSVAQERLNALFENRKPNFEQFDSTFADEVKDARRLYAENIHREDAGKAILEHQVSQINSQLRELQSEEKALSQNISLLKQEYDLRKPLVEEGLNSRVGFLALERNYNEARARRAYLPERRLQLQEKRREKQSQLKEYSAIVKENYAKEYALVKSELQTLERSSSYFRENVDYQSVEAPVSGYIHGLRLSSALEVVEPGEELMEIVPDGQMLEVVVEIQAKDIGHIKKGQHALVKLTTFNFNRYGGISGTITELSPSAFLKRDGNSYYKAIISLEKQYVGKKQHQFEIGPGMTVSADIQTGSKTLMDYLLKPIHLSTQEAFTER